MPAHTASPPSFGSPPLCAIIATRDDSFYPATVALILRFVIAVGGERGPPRRRQSGKGRAVPRRCRPLISCYAGYVRGNRHEYRRGSQAGV
jgi:hypothetical protein